MKHQGTVIQSVAMSEPSAKQQRAAAPSTTQTQTTQTRTEHAPRILRLRGGHNATGRSVQWADDVVDNEGLGRKSSKVCCIYHKPKGVDESSDESSSSDSDSDSEPERADGKKTVACGHGHSRRRGRENKRERAPSPNAYEKVPRQKHRDEESE